MMRPLPISCVLLVALSALSRATLVNAQSATMAPGLLVFTAYVGHGNPSPQSLAVRRTATAFQVTSQQAAWLTVTPRAGQRPGALTVNANAAGLRPGKYQDRIVVTDSAATDTVPVVLNVIAPPAGAAQFAIYEIEVSMTGYVGLLNGAPNCRVRTNGYDRMVGTVAGYETTGTDDDVIYTGTLRRETDIDYCETKKNPTVDQRTWCAISLTGFAVEDVEINVNFDSLSGAWMKAQPTTPWSRRITSTTCDAQETNDALNAYPTASDGGAGSPNGQQLDDVKGPAPFSANGTVRLRIGTFPPDAPDGWTLRVIRKLP